MLVGPTTRKRSSQKRYMSHIRKVSNSKCEFCEFTSKTPQVIESKQRFYIVENVFGYDIWDGCKVTEHLMIVPKRHINSLSELDEKESHDYLNIIASYEATGYSLYSRSPDNITKSVPHLHTHLIKTDNKRKKIILYLRKPHVMVSK